MSRCNWRTAGSGTIPVFITPRWARYSKSRPYGVINRCVSKNPALRPRNFAGHIRSVTNHLIQVHALR